MRMKHLLSLMMLALTGIMAFTFSACSDDDNINSTTGVLTISENDNERDSETALGCGTVASSEPPSWLYTRAASSSDVDLGMSYQFRLYFHVIRKSDGSAFMGATRESIQKDAVNCLNSYYSDFGISFKTLGSEYLDSDSYDSLSDSMAKNIFSINRHTNAIDVYVFTGITARDKWKISGMAEDIPGRAVLLRLNSYKTTTIVHEIGHCLGLYHTHHGTCSSESGIPELVDGSNAYTAGDFIADTPADPNKWDSVTGDYIGGNIVDANGDYYMPDPANLMSYCHPKRHKFTQQQVARMYSTIAQNSKLSYCANGIINEISGPDYINSSGNYSIYVPSSDYDVTWTVKCETFTKTMTSTTDKSTYKGSSITLVNKNPNATSQKYTLSAVVTSPNGIKRSTSKIVRHVLLSGSTGTLKWDSSGSSFRFGEIPLYPQSGIGEITVTKGGTLNFYYYDASGGSSYLDSEYYSFIISEMDGTNFFTKNKASNHTFECSRFSACPSQILLGVTINGETYSTIYVRVKVAN